MSGSSASRMARSKRSRPAASRASAALAQAVTANSSLRRSCSASARRRKASPSTIRTGRPAMERFRWSGSGGPRTIGRIAPGLNGADSRPARRALPSPRSSGSAPMADLTVSADGTCRFGGAVYRCALGRGGIVADKREGDGGTPAGIWPLRRLLYRPDRRGGARLRPGVRAHRRGRRLVRRPPPSRLQPAREAALPRQP